MRRPGGLVVTARYLVLIPLSSVAALLVFCSLAQAEGGFLASYADPQNPQHIFAIFDSASPDGTFLLHSKDRGKTWEKIPDPSGSGYLTIYGRGYVAGDFFVSIGPPERPRLVVTYAIDLKSLWRASSDLRWQEYSLAFPTSEFGLCSCGFLVYPP